MPVGLASSIAARRRSAISWPSTWETPGQHDQELLAAEAVDELEGAQPLAQLIGDVAQHRVAAVVAVASLTDLKLSTSHSTMQIGWWVRRA